MLCTLRNLNDYSSVVHTVGYSISQTRYPGSTYLVNGTPFCYRHCFLCHFMLVLRKDFAGSYVKVMSLYTSLFTRVIIRLCKSYNAGYKVPQRWSYKLISIRIRRPGHKLLQNHMMFVSLETANVDVILSPCNRDRMSFRNSEHN